MCVLYKIIANSRTDFDVLIYFDFFLTNYVELLFLSYKNDSLKLFANFIGVN